ncbi:MAG: hypothetical protein V4593_08320 [Pseudomonadota bacterium]
MSSNSTAPGGAGGFGGWSFEWRRAARRLVADAMAVVALAVVLGLMWWFGGMRP